MLENKSILLIMMLVLGAFPLWAEPVVPTQNFTKSLNIQPSEDELVTIERLLLATQKQCEVQEKLKKLITKFQQEKDLFIKGEQSKLHARYMIATATEIAREIWGHGMQHLFASDFIEELALFTSIGKKDRVDVRNQIR